MAYHLTCKIEIGKYTFDYAESVEIQSSWQELGDTCTIKLPKFGKQLEKNIQSGDKVRVYLGYNGDNRLEFQGYVSEVGAAIPFEVRCQDTLYLLKRYRYEGKLYKNATLEEVLNEVLSSFQNYLKEPISVVKKGLPDISVGNINIGSGLTYAEILQKLKEDYFFAAYFRANYLYVGLPYLEYAGKKPTQLDFSKNVVDATGLKFLKKEDTKIKVRAISLMPNNQRIEVEAGDSDGEVRTLHTRNENNPLKLKEWANAMLDNLKYDGYKGDVILFGVPHVEHTQGAHLVDKNYPERQGVYAIDKVRVSFGRTGFRRFCELGKKLS